MAKEITYLKRTLSADEEICVVAEIHWIAYLLPIIMGFLFIWTIIVPIWTLIKLLSLSKTEMVCTNKRVIYKIGIIAVKTLELRNTKVEAISIQQSFFGRLFGYASLVFTGTGNTAIDMVYVKDPIIAKSSFERVIEENTK